MSYGGDLKFTIRHSPVTRLPANDRNDKDGGAFVQMKVIVLLISKFNNTYLYDKFPNFSIEYILIKNYINSMTKNGVIRDR